MNKRNKNISSHIVIFFLGFIVGIGIINPFGFFSYKEIIKFSFVNKVAKLLYYEDFNKKQMLDGAIAGSVGAIGDIYTEYLNESTNEVLEKSISGKYTGIGIIISTDEEGFIYVVSSFEGSPARIAGLNGGERIILINDNEAKNMSEASSMMLGEPGSQVKLSVLKKGSDKIEELEITRANIKLDMVKSELLGDSGYVKVFQFSENIDMEFEKVLLDFEEKGVKNLIIDLRDNPGGLIDGATKMLDFFVPSDKVLVYTINKFGYKTEYKSTSRKKYDFNLAILVNSKSASASEVLVGAMKDYEQAIVLGEKTFGKGVVQQLIKIPKGCSLKVTVSRYYTPNGLSIDKKGIEPDVYVRSKFSKNLNEDPAVIKAIETFKHEVANKSSSRSS